MENGTVHSAKKTRTKYRFFIGQYHTNLPQGFPAESLRDQVPDQKSRIQI